MALPASVAAMQVTLGQHTATLAQHAITLDRVLNASASMDGHALVRICLPNGNPLPADVWFPATRGDLMGPGLTNVHADALLAAYGLPGMAGANPVAVHAKRAAIAAHIGTRVM